ncbi:hypothetical protein TSUD_85410 [Trifolium subterraneum]|uniref:Legume lectin domain-containing protein n=1 Tax=Trifolium subterraneum TaxID=3900 RepID=A0A2Z6PSY1_TRISU|nr:hypothetical protein TSUD_85410 [Trifolium subterraneum]
MISVANVTWLADIIEGKLNEAWVSYNASSLNLSVIFTGFNNVTSTTVNQHLSSIVDLRLYLPEFVTIGFSAATGNSTAVHTLNSWDFRSNLEGEEDKNKTNSQDPVARSPSFNTAPTKMKKAKTGLALGLGIGGFVLIEEGQNTNIVNFISSNTNSSGVTTSDDGSPSESLVDSSSRYK